MPRIRLSACRGRALVRWARRTGDAALIMRVLVVHAIARARTPSEIVGWLGCSAAHVSRTVAYFEDEGRDGLLDARTSNGARLVDEEFEDGLRALLDGSPREHGWKRPTWTRELLVIVMERRGHPRVSVCTMGRALRRIRARRGRPKPIVKCRLSARQKRRRLKKIRDLIENQRPNEVVVYEDEIDIHLNPKIGLDWMNYGQQKLVMTPGKNEKAYVAGTLDVRTRNVLWVGGIDKNSTLFIEMLRKLDAHHPSAKWIYVVLDNFGIHKSRATKAVLRELPRIRLIFLPPYSPDDNIIERLWLDLHANVTRNHQHTELPSLCDDVASYLDAVSPWAPRERPLLLEAA